MQLMDSSLDSLYHMKNVFKKAKKPFGNKLTYKVSCNYYNFATLFKIELVIHTKLKIFRAILICLYNLGELSVINRPTKPKQ